MSQASNTPSRFRYPPPIVGALVIGLALLGIGYVVADDIDSFLLGAAVSTALLYAWFELVSKHRRRRKGKT